MGKFELGQKVKILATGIEGIVNSVWEQRGSAIKYGVVYYDTTGRRAESWLLGEEISET